MEAIQNELFGNLETYLAVYTQNDSAVMQVGTLERIFEYIRENARLCKLLLGERGELNFQKRVFTLIYEKSIHDLTKSGAISKVDAEYIYAFTLTGCVGLIRKWLNDDMKKTPRFMAETIIKLTTGLTELVEKNLS